MRVLAIRRADRTRLSYGTPGKPWVHSSALGKWLAQSEARVDALRLWLPAGLEQRVAEVLTR
jgi:hypothetical protein